MSTTPQPFDSTYFDSPYFNPAEAANVAADPNTPGEFDFSDLVISPTTLANATVGFSYTGNITISGGFEPYESLSVIDGAANITAANLVFSVDTANYANANITGISNVDQTVTFTVQGSDDFGPFTYATSQTYNLQVVRPNVTVGPSTLTNAVVGTYYTQTFTSTNGSGSITYSNIGNLPSGMSLVSATGNMSGIVNSNVTPINFTIVATDAYSSTGNTVYSWNIEQPVIDIDPPSVSDGVVGVAYAQTISAYGGIAPYTYSITGGVLPANVSLGFNTGNLIGTPTANGLSNFTVTAYDLYQSPGSRTYSPDIALPVITFNPTSLTNATTGRYYQKNIVASGGTGPYTYAVTSNALPANLSLSTSGVLDGIVNQPSTTTFTITATDSYNSTGNIVYTLVTDPITLVVGPSTIPDGTCGTAYAAQFFTSAGIEPYTFSVTAGSLPPGLTLNPLTGVLSGICVDDNTYSFTITVTDAYLNTGSNSYTVNFVADILPNSLPNPTERIPYTQILSTVGGVAPYTYALDSGTLPTGLSLINNLITGTPVTPGPYSFIISSTDSASTVITQSYSLTVLTQPPISISPVDNVLPKARLDFEYSETFVAAGGNPPYVYTISSGVLPSGLTLNGNTGVLSGVVTQAGLFPFNIVATDNANFSISKPYQLPVLEYPYIPDNVIKVYVGGALQPSGLFTAKTVVNSNVLVNVSNFDNLSVGTYLQGTTINSNVVIASIDQPNSRIVMSNVAASSSTNVQVSYSTGYTITSKTPATVAFDMPPPEGVNVTIAILQGHSWYRNGLLTASDGVPLQEQTTPDAKFLQGK